MTRARTLWLALVAVLFLGGLVVAAVSPEVGVVMLLGSILALVGLLLVLQHAARHTEGWSEPGPFHAGSGLGPRGPRKPDA